MMLYLTFNLHAITVLQLILTFTHTFASNQTYMWQSTNITRQQTHVQYMRFKKLTRGYKVWATLGRHIDCNFSGSSKMECADTCMRKPMCVTWTWREHYGLCRCSAEVYRVSPTYILQDNQFDAYEIWNPCMQNALLCEHGSICSPNRLTKTYQCLHCFPPYTGKHCNETGPSIPSTISQDILLGKNASCIALKEHFNIPNGLQQYTIHPWRDQRKIHIKCSGKVMRFTRLDTRDQAPVKELKAASMEDGLVLENNYRAHASFLRMAKILMNFETIRMKCVRNTTELVSLGNKRQASDADFNVIRYFSGESDSRPVETTSSWRSRLNGVWDDYPIDAVDDLLSADNVEKEYRPFKDIYIGNDGLKMTFTNESQQCFGPEGDFNHYLLEVY
ncbi:uncharacterized protein [Clytia hemisphaerica]|uniref:uncharacterized protein n=1 Tax=Clytia hemisphaerica TaxID=252671 RepID=UPI0034D75352